MSFTERLREVKNRCLLSRLSLKHIRLAGFGAMINEPFRAKPTPNSCKNKQDLEHNWIIL